MKYNYLGLFVLLLVPGISHTENISLIVQKGNGNKAIVSQKESNTTTQTVVELTNSNTVSGNTAISRQTGECNLSIQNQNGLNNSAYVSSLCK